MGFKKGTDSSEAHRPPKCNMHKQVAYHEFLLCSLIAALIWERKRASETKISAEYFFQEHYKMAIVIGRFA